MWLNPLDISTPRSRNSPRKTSRRTSSILQRHCAVVLDYLYTMLSIESKLSLVQVQDRISVPTWKKKCNPRSKVRNDESRSHQKQDPSHVNNDEADIFDLPQGESSPPSKIVKAKRRQRIVDTLQVNSSRIVNPEAKPVLNKRRRPRKGWC